MTNSRLTEIEQRLKLAEDFPPSAGDYIGYKDVRWLVSEHHRLTARIDALEADLKQSIFDRIAQEPRT